jgi:hypothetical protein
LNPQVLTALPTGTARFIDWLAACLWSFPRHWRHPTCTIEFTEEDFMTKSRSGTALRLLPLVGMLMFAATSLAQHRPPIVEKLAKTYGLESFGQIEGIRYTFSAELPGINLSRSWTWEPKTDQVTYEGNDKSGKPVKVTYLRSQLGSQSAEVQENIDPGFLNDQYWLLLPFHVSWDTSATVQDAGVQKLPLGNGSADKVVVKYPSDSGYSPGDTWDLYVGADGRIQEMVFHRGGPRKPSTVIAAWADYKQAGPLLVSLDHPGTADGKPLHVSFSNVAVKVAGSTTWMEAK